MSKTLLPISSNKEKEIKELRDDQKKIINVLSEMEKEYNNFSTIVELATGGGKTVIAVEYLVNQALKSGKKVLWLAHRDFLLEQAKEKFNKRLSNEVSIDRKISCITISSSNSTLSDLEVDTDIVFGSIRSMDTTNENFVKWLKCTQEEDSKLYIVIDEAHHVCSEDGTYNNFLTSLLIDKVDKAPIKSYGLLGLTATPFREDYDEINFFRWFKNGYIEEYFEEKDKKDYLKVDTNKLTHIGTELGKIYSNSNEKGKTEVLNKNNKTQVIDLDGLISKGVVLEPNFIRVDDFNYTDKQNDKNKILDSFVENIVKSKDLGKVIAFFSTIDDVTKVKEKLEKKKPSFYFSDLTSNTSEDRNTILENFKNSTNALLLTVDIVSEGYDLRDLNTIILVDATKSKTRLRQRIGRVVRSADNIKECRVIWYYYQGYNDTKPQCGPYKSEDSGYLFISPQDEKSLEEDRIRKTYYLTAPKYKDKIGYKDEYDCTTAKEYIQLLNIIDLFKDNDLEKFTGIYIFGDFKIYVDEVLDEGIKQLRRRLQTEYLIARHNKPEGKITLQDIAGGEREIPKYINNVMEICFYLCKPSRTVFHISFDDVKMIIEYLLNNNCKLPEKIDMHKVLLNIVDKLYSRSEEDENKTLKSDNEDELLLIAKDTDEYKSLLEQIDDEQLICAMLKKIINEELKKQKERAEKVLEEANKAADDKINEIESVDGKVTTDEKENIKMSKLLMKEINEKSKNLFSKTSSSKRRRDHDFTIQLKDGAFDKHMESLKKTISSGATWSEEYVKCKCNKCGDMKPIVFMNFDSTSNSVSCKDCKKTKKQVVIKDYDSKYKAKYTTQVFAQCQIENTHHLVVTEKDIIDFRDILVKSLKKYNIQVPEEEQDNLVKDVLCSIAYGDIGVLSLKELTKLCCDLPRLLAYYLYDKVYNGVFNAEFIAENEEIAYISCNCQNIKDLKDEANRILEKYGLCLNDLHDLNLYPIRDLIYDSKPYVKVLQSYQGIKPDLLCRMNNFIINQLPNNDEDEDGKVNAIEYSYLSGCGGSGADLINLDTNVNITEKYYNEYGFAITTFYKVLKNNKNFKKLCRRIEAFIRYIINAENVDFEEKVKEDWFSIIKEEDFFKEKFEGIKIDKDKNDEEKKIAIKALEKKICRLQELSDKSSEELGVKTREDLKNRNKKDKEEDKDKGKDKEKEEREKLFRIYPSLKKWFWSDSEEDNYDKKKYDAQIIKRENILHGVYQRCQALYDIAQDLNDSMLRNTYIDEVDWAFIVFIYLSFPDRQLHDNCFMSYFIPFASKYKSYLQLGEEILSGVSINTNEPRDINNVLSTNSSYEGLKLGNDDKCIAYCDIPYAETDAEMYVSECFYFKEFVESLNAFKGYYIVSSRYNICATSDLKKIYYHQNELTDEEKDTFKKDTIKYKKRVAEIIRFYYSFLSNDKELKIEDEDIKQEDKNDKQKNKECKGLMSKERVPKYIIMPYTAKEEARDGNRVERKLSNNYRLGKKDVINDIEAMLKRVLLSNIPVEIMLTNIDMLGNENSTENPLLNSYKLDENVYIIPTLNSDITSTNYYAEPVYVVMKYEWYIEKMIENITEERKLNKEEIKDLASFMRNNVFNKNR